MTLFGSQTVPAHGLLVVPGNAAAFVVQDAKREPGFCMALFGSKTNPADGFLKILGHPPAVKVTDGEIELGLGIALFGGQTVSVCGARVVAAFLRVRRQGAARHRQ